MGATVTWTWIKAKVTQFVLRVQPNRGKVTADCARIERPCPIEASLWYGASKARVGRFPSSATVEALK